MDDLEYLRQLEQFQRLTKFIHQERECYIKALTGGEGERADAKIIGAMKAYDEIHDLFNGGR